MKLYYPLDLQFKISFSPLLAFLSFVSLLDYRLRKYVEHSNSTLQDYEKRKCRTLFRYAALALKLYFYSMQSIVTALLSHFERS